MNGPAREGSPQRRPSGQVLAAERPAVIDFDDGSDPFTIELGRQTQLLLRRHKAQSGD